MNLGDFIYGDLLKNSYLKILYKKLLESYYHFTTNLIETNALTDKEIIDLLRFADILSKSTEDSKRDDHNNLAQSIVSMLNRILPESPIIKHVSGSVLSNVNNYLGLDKNFPDYSCVDLLERVKECIKRDEYYIPNSENSHFINSQKLAYERIKTNDFYSFSAPTSMGKTFLIRMYIKDNVVNNIKKNFAIVVPSKALINEVTNDIIDDLRENLVKQKYKVIQSSSMISDDEEFNYIMVFTQERLLQFLTQNKEIKLSHVFIDEAHKISDLDERSPFFYKCIQILEKEHFGVKINFSCPNIPNPEVYLNTIKSSGNKAFNRFRYSPVNQIKSIVDIANGCSYIYNDLDKHFLKVDHRTQTRPSLMNLLKGIGKEKSNIVFCNSRNDVTKYANEYCSLINEDCSENKEILELIKEIREEIHEKCYLTKTLLKGVAYHVAYLPSTIKEKIEKLYRNKIIKTIFCTSTLLEGVNFPADNLFINLNKKDIWLKDVYRASFKNLVGRVGRIDFNLFGNVFCVSEDANEEYRKAISRDVDNQKLSIEILTDNRKKDIIELLKSGKTTLTKRSVDNYATLNYARKTLNLLLNEILEDREGVVSESFQKFLNDETINVIKNAFKNKADHVPSDLVATYDEMQKLDIAITENNLQYTDFNYNSICSFLLRLHDIFNWGCFESKNDIGNRRRLRYYAILMMRWVFGISVKEMIDATIEYCKTNGVFYKYPEPHKEDFNGTPDQINKIINEVLDDIDKILQFKLPNYFLKFSERYKELKNMDTIPNDWYELLEYGTNKHIVIALQKQGLSRDFAFYVYRNKLYKADGKRIKIDIKNVTNSKYSEEVKRYIFNNSDAL